MRDLQSRASMPTHEDGFTIIELIVAFTILLVGMTGIITLFSAGLSLEREGTLNYDTSRILDELQPIVKRELLEEIKTGGADGEIGLTRTPVPGHPELDYTVSCRPMPGDELQMGYLVTVTVYAPAQPEDKAFSYGPLPMILEPSHEEMVQKAMQETLK